MSRGHVEFARAEIRRGRHKALECLDELIIAEEGSAKGLGHSHEIRAELIGLIVQHGVFMPEGLDHQALDERPNRQSSFSRV